MIWMIVCSCVVGAWALLTVVGNERQTRLQQMEYDAELKAQTAQKEAEAAAKSKSVENV